jgi:hypothetical protein
MRRGQREAAAAGGWLQAAAAREKKVAAAREQKGTAVGKEMAAAGAKRTATGAAGAAKGMARELPASEGTAGVFQSPGASTFSQFPSTAGVGDSMNGCIWTQSIGGSPNGQPLMRHQAFDPSTW